MRRSVFRGAVLAGLALSVGGAAADCYDVFGCTDRDRFNVRALTSGPDCEFLYTMRNAIYAQHHYCFQTPRGIATFGNQGCVSSNANALGLSAIELGNATAILQAEQARRCPE